jgi:hypothetical protein
MPEFARYEAASGSTDPVRVDFQVRPVPLDLAGPALADVTIVNSGAPIACQEIRVEIWSRGEVTIAPPVPLEELLWAASRKGSSLPTGESHIRFQIPAINRAWPDVDLQHGWMRGEMRLVIDIPLKRDICVQRDLALCLDKPRAGAGS